MRRNHARGRIYPKVSTMPRQPSEAAAFLDIYKLVIEKKRLQQELQGIEQRRQQILDRLTILETQVTDLEASAQCLRQASSPALLPPEQFQPQTTVPSLSSLAEDKTLETLFLEY
jgi:hypothetical protein